MRVATTTGREKVVVTQAPDPVPGPGEALLRVEHVTLCGTDLHIWEDDYASELPIVQGHEASATVVALGDAAPGGPRCADGRPLTIGDRVVVSPMVTCGRCHACRVGRSNACRRMSVLGCYEDGLLADLAAVPTYRLHVVPVGLPLELAALAEPVSIALQAVRRGRATAGERVLVLGCGPIGVLATLALADLGAHVHAADTVADRLTTARRMGAEQTHLVCPGFPDDAQRAALLVPGGDGPELVIDATGAPSSLVTALDLVATAGRVVQVGISDRTVELSLRTLPVKELDLLGSRNSAGLLGEALDLVDRHRDLVGSLITHRVPLDRLDEAFTMMRDRPAEVGKIAVALGGAA